MRARAASLNAALHAAPGPWLAEADIVVSAVYGHSASAVAQACLAFLRADAVYADFTTASAADMQAAASWPGARAGLHGRGHHGRHRPAGRAHAAAVRRPGADQVIALAASGGAPARHRRRARRRRAAQAAAQHHDQGMESLAVECLVAANAMGLRASLYEVLSDIDRTPLTTFMDAFVRSHVDHAGRRHAEVREARDQLHEAGLEPLVLDGVERLFARTARHLKPPAPRAASKSRTPSPRGWPGWSSWPASAEDRAPNSGRNARPRY